MIPIFQRNFSAIAKVAEHPPQAAWRQYKGIRMDRAAAAIQRLRAEVERKKQLEASLRAAVVKAYGGYMRTVTSGSGRASNASSKAASRDHSRCGWCGRCAFTFVL